METAVQMRWLTDYSINRQVILAIKPGRYHRPQPGTSRRYLLIESPDESVPLRRILPEAKPAQSEIIDVLRVFRKWKDAASDGDHTTSHAETKPSTFIALH